MDAYKVKFRKKDNSLRDMRFVKVENLPEKFLVAQLKPLKQGETRKKLELPLGMELVWDLDKHEFRTLNHHTIVGNIESFEANDSEL